MLYSYVLVVNERIETTIVLADSDTVQQCDIYMFIINSKISVNNMIYNKYLPGM